jgi:hypothetical protein
MLCRTYIEITENAHLGGRCCSIALFHPSVLGLVDRLLFCKHRRLLYVEECPSPGSSDLTEEVGWPEGSTFTEPGAEDGDFTVAFPDPC